MNFERTKNASRNIWFGALLKTFQIIIPFILRTAMIHFMGIEYLGLNSLFTSILQVLNLAELGVGAAMVYSMYEPISKSDEKSICALLKLYRKYYNFIGFVIVLLGIFITPFVPRLISGSVPAGINVYVLFWLNLSATVLSYWVFAYRNSVLQAHQRNDVISKITLITNTIQYILQFFVLWLLKDYYIFVMVSLFTQLLTNIVTAFVSIKMYPQYNAKGFLEKQKVDDIKQRISDLFTSKVGQVVVLSVDTIVISAFLGLEMLAVYQNYYFILSAVIGMVEVIFVSCTAGIGNSIIVESKEKNYNDLNIITFIIAWIAGVCVCCFLNLFQPFMNIWVGDRYILKFPAVICFCVYFFVYEINRVLNTYKDAGGIWHSDKYRPLCTALTNLIMNIVTVQFLGIYGVLLSTVVSMLFVGIPWILHNLFSTLFEMKYIKEYIKKLVLYVVVVSVSSFVTFILCNRLVLGPYLTVFVRLVLCVVIPNVLFFVVYRRTVEFGECWKLIKKMLGSR